MSALTSTRYFWPMVRRWSLSFSTLAVWFAERSSVSPTKIFSFTVAVTPECMPAGSNAAINSPS